MPTIAARKPLAAALVLFALVLHAGPSLADDAAEPAAEPAQERAMAQPPLRHLLVKAIGEGANAQEAEGQLRRNARELAVQHLQAIGGERALAQGPEAVRLASIKHFPQLGFGPARVVGLVEFRLRGLPSPAPKDSPLLDLRATVSGRNLTIEADRACEAVVAYAPSKAGETEYLPGGTRSFRLRPGRVLQTSTPPGGVALGVLACTGGLSMPVNPLTFDDAQTRAREGRPRPSQVEGVVSDCVLLDLDGTGRERALRLKGAQAPVNMSGAAGRESGLPVPNTAP
ncbi:MAG: hypothetical protein HY916_00255 [Desulfovibrio sp.]|jgi:hypothetical protein|nr:hypothetical protein [Desulfovibrio sp.]